MSLDPASLLAQLHAAQAILYAGGDTAPVERLLDSEIVWRVPGENLIAGTYHGVPEVIGYMRRRGQLANDTFRMHLRELLVGPAHFAALTDGTAVRNGVTHTWSTIGLYRAREGRVSDCSLIPLDAKAFDAVWR